MYEHWNKEQHKKRYDRIMEEAKNRGFTDEELERPYLDKLSHKTGSARIMRMITLAYYLGELRGVRDIDEGYTPVTLS